MRINDKVHTPDGFGVIVGSDVTRGQEKQWQVKLANGNRKWYYSSQIEKAKH